MAKEAIQSIKEAEEEVKKILQEATETSRKSRDEAIIQAEDQYEKIPRSRNKCSRITGKSQGRRRVNIKPILEKGELDAKSLVLMKIA